MNPKAPRNEFQRLIYATRNSLKGYARVFRDEAAFRTQTIVLVAVIPLAAWLGRSWTEFALLVGAWTLVLAAELGNSAIEAVVDRVGREEHDLAGKAQGAFEQPCAERVLPEKPQIVWCEPSDSSHSYDRGSQRARCGFSGETLQGRTFAGAPLRFGSLIWNNQTALAKATPEHPVKAPSRPRRVVQMLPETQDRRW